MVVAQGVIIAFLGVAALFFWLAFQFTEKHDVLKGLLLCLGLMMLLITVSMTQHFIQVDAETYGYSGTAAYNALIKQSGTAFTAFTYMLYVVLTYIVIYYVFFVITPKAMDAAMNIGVVKKSKKYKEKKAKEKEDNDDY